MLLADVRALIGRAEFPAAQQLLRDQLAESPQDPDLADAEDAETAALYAGVLLHVGEPHTARAWSGYAYRAMRRLRGQADRRTLHTLGLLALALQRSGALEQAAEHYNELITALSSVDGPDGDRTLAAYADAAVVEHARGMCGSARSTLSDVIAAYTAKHGPEHPMTLRMTIRLAGMWRDCGDFSRAQQLLAHAKALTVSHPPEHEVHRLIVDAMHAQPDPGHQCGLPSTSDHDVTYQPMRVSPEEWPDDELYERPRGALARDARSAVSRPSPLPVPVQRPLVVTPPPPQSRRPDRKGLIAVVAASVATIAAAIIVIIALASRQNEPPAQPARPTSTAQLVAPVANLRLDDKGDTLLVTWVYPPSAGGPIIVSMAPAGEPMRPMQSLPSGSESYTQPGLDPKRNYCVAVTVAYRTDQTVMSQPVCTKR